MAHAFAKFFPHPVVKLPRLGRCSISGEPRGPSASKSARLIFAEAPHIGPTLCAALCGKMRSPRPTLRGSAEARTRRSEGGPRSSGVTPNLVKILEGRQDEKLVRRYLTNKGLNDERRSVWGVVLPHPSHTG